MQRPIAARRALAVELLRRLDQTQTRRHRSHSLPARSHFAHDLQIRGQSPTVAHLHLHRPEPPRLPPGLHIHQHWQSALGSAMDGAGLGTLIQEDVLNVSGLHNIPPASSELVQKQNFSPALPEGILKADNSSRSDSSCTPPLSDIGASGSDTTSRKGDESYSPKAGKPVADSEDDAVVGAEEDNTESPDRTLVDITDMNDGPITPLYHRHRRNFSVESASTTTRRSAPRR